MRATAMLNDIVWYYEELVPLLEMVRSSIRQTHPANEPQLTALGHLAGKLEQQIAKAPRMGDLMSKLMFRD